LKGIRKRSENSYTFTVSLGKGLDNKYKRAHKTYVVTQNLSPKKLEEHLQREYLKYKQEVLADEYIAPEKMTFKQFSIEWEEKFAKNELAATALGNHQLKLKNHILPVIGHHRMDKINHLILLDLLSKLTRKDGKEGELTGHSKQDIYRTLQSIFKYAYEWRVINKNPMKGISKPKHTTKVNEALQVYTEDEITKLLHLLQGLADHWRVLFTLAVAAGLRRGELLGLEWSKVDFVNNQIEITQSIVLSKEGPVIKGPKSKSSRRIVTLPDSVMNELKEYKEVWHKKRNDLGDKWIEKKHEWLFCNFEGGHLYPSTPSNWWKKFIVKNNFRYIRFHDLRHTSASLLIAKEVHAKIISERLGHSDISITMNTYGHALKSADRAAGDKFEDLFKKE
jgi:integrase